MTNEKYMQVFRDLDVWMKQTSGFGESLPDDYDYENGDIHESYIKIFTSCDIPATIIRNNCKQSIENNAYCGDSIEVHNDYLEITKGSSNKNLVTTYIPYDKISLFTAYSGELKK